MKVLTWAPLFWPDTGGIETISAQLLQALHTRGHEFVVLTAHSQSALPAQMTYADTPVYRFPMIEALSQRNLRQILAIQRAIIAIKQTFQPDLIHLHLGGPTPLAYFHLQTAQVAPAPILLTAHNCFTAFAGRTESVFNTCLQSADWVTASSETIRQDLLTVAPGIAPYTTTLRCCLPPPATPPTPLDFARPRLLYLGRLVAEKGVDLLLAAFHRLAIDYPELTLWIAGDGPARTPLAAQVEAWQLGDRVCFMGNRPWHETEALLNASTIVLMPSRWREPFGLVALEAANMARPIVATGVGGLPEIVEHGQTGYLIEPEDPAAMAAAIVELLTHPAQAQQMGEAAQQHVRTNFDWQRYVDSYEQLYSRLVHSTER